VFLKTEKKMAGGIQKGTIAMDKNARKLDKQVRVQSKLVFEELKKEYPELVRLPKLLKKHFVYDGACQPDGGVFFFEDKLIAAFEAKKQGPRGNAIERWFKNWFHINRLSAGDSCPLLTFATGEGTLPNNPIYKTLLEVHAGVYNKFRDNGPSCFLQQKNFTNDEIFQIMMDYLRIQLRIVMKEKSKRILGVAA
jgi:hypothetical protein